MPEQSDLRETPYNAETAPTLKPIAEPQAQTGKDNSIRTVMSLCCLGIIACFFLPWIQLFLATPSGYQLQQLPSDEVKLLWLIPLTAAVALVAAVTGKSMAIAGQTAGAMPFMALIYYAAKVGQGLFQALQIGAYLTLLCAAVLCIAPHFLSRPKS
jgi:hypothetical protein